MDCNILKDEVLLDNEILIMYISDNLNGHIKADSIYANPYGEGRIKTLTEADKENKDENDLENNGQNNNQDNNNAGNDVNNGNQNNGNQSGDKSDESENSNKAPVTGDESHYIMFVLLSSMAVVIICGNRKLIKMK